MGRLFGLPTPDPFASKLPWAWILNTIGSDQNWFERYGMSMHRSNSGFWNFLVRGVGRPPVVWFLLLISVFMIVAGPVNYLMLRSRGKLALLLVTVPAGSFMVTICLLAYSLLSDGLGVQWRCRSVTVLDSNRGTAVSWSRHSYFAGLAPRSGLEFPRDAAVYPLEFDPAESLGQFGAAHAVTWSGTQRLQSGYLSSRTPTQFLVVRSGECDARLEVREGSAAKQPPQVVNNLGVVIRGMVLRDSRGDLWRPEGKSEAGAELVHATEEEARDYLREKLQPWILEANAPGVAPVNSFRWSAVAVDPYSQSAPDTSSSMLESKIKEFHSAARLDALMPRSWVAIVDRSPHVVPGVAKVEAQDDLHLILGSY